jgi:hypothetical protein
VLVLLETLKANMRSDLAPPFVAPVPGGGVQLEWRSGRRYLELEFVGTSKVVYLAEDLGPEGEKLDVGEYPPAESQRTRQLLDWLSGAAV